MRISVRFTAAVHTLLCINYFDGTCKVTSDFIAGSTGVHPVIIRKILLRLQKAGLVSTAPGKGGSHLEKSPEDITLLDVYHAVKSDEDEVFNFHPNPNGNCPIGQNIEPRNYYYYRIINHRICNSLYFHYEDKERIRDKKSDGRGRFLSLYISVDKFDENLNREKCERISYENDNYKLGWIINYQSAMNCILKIKDFNKKDAYLNKLKNTKLLNN